MHRGLSLKHRYFLGYEHLYGIYFGMHYMAYLAIACFKDAHKKIRLREMNSAPFLILLHCKDYFTEM